MDEQHTSETAINFVFILFIYVFHDLFYILDY